MFKWYVINDAYISLLRQAFFERLLIFEIPSAGTDLNAPSPEIVTVASSAPSGVTSGKMRAELYLQKRLNYNGAMTLLQKQSQGEI